MDIKEIKKEKEQLESELANYIRTRIKEFNTTTEVWPNYLSVTLHLIEELGCLEPVELVVSTAIDIRV